MVNYIVVTLLFLAFQCLNWTAMKSVLGKERNEGRMEFLTRQAADYRQLVLYIWMSEKKWDVGKKR